VAKIGRDHGRARVGALFDAGRRKALQRAGEETR